MDLKIKFYNINIPSLVFQFFFSFELDPFCNVLFFYFYQMTCQENIRNNVCCEHWSKSELIDFSLLFMHEICKTFILCD